MKMNNNQLLNKLEKARTKIFINEPFLGYILQHIQINLSDEEFTARTNGIKIEISKNFLKDLTLDEIVFVLLHELLHIILKHPSRSISKNKYKFNVACDIVINDIIKSYGINHGNLKPIFGEMFDILGYYLSAERVYKELKIYEDVKLLDDHDFWKALSKKELEKINDIIKIAIKEGYTINDSKLSRMINRLNHFKKRVDWPKVLAKYISKDLFDYTYNRIDNRYKDVLLPSFIENEDSLNKVWFLIDVSGSISKDQLSLLFGEIEKIISHYKTIQCDISFFSTITTTPITFTSKKDLLELDDDIDSTGGTDFIQIFTNLKKYYKSKLPKLMIILTDGYAEYPTKKESLGVPVIWVLSEKVENQNKPPFGKIIAMK